MAGSGRRRHRAPGLAGGDGAGLIECSRYLRKLCATKATMPDHAVDWTIRLEAEPMLVPVGFAREIAAAGRALIRACIGDDGTDGGGAITFAIDRHPTRRQIRLKMLVRTGQPAALPTGRGDGAGEDPDLRLAVGMAQRLRGQLLIDRSSAMRFELTVPVPETCVAIAPPCPPAS